MDAYQHKPKLKQINKSHHRNKEKGKVEKKAINAIAAPKKDMNREERYHRSQQLRKNKREQMIKDRRGMKSKTIDVLTIDNEVKERVKPYMHNVAPKIVALIPLNEACDLEQIKIDLENECGRGGEEMKIESNDLLKAHLVNVGGVVGVKRQRLIFYKCERDPHALLDVSKVADILVFVLSCEKAQVDKLRDDPDEYAHAIDEIGYKMLSNLRVQGIPPCITALQHIEKVSNKRQNEVKRLFRRYFVSELGDDSKFVVLDSTDESTVQSNSNTLIRLITSTFAKTKLFWKDNRSYMFSSNYKPTESQLIVEGYIRENYLSCNRIAHITGVGDFKILQISAPDDPCTVKSHSEKLSKKVNDDTEMGAESNQVLQEYDASKADGFEVENQVDPFGAEQTWPTKDEMEKRDELMHDEYKNDQQNDMPEEIDTDFKVPAPKKAKNEVNDLANKFERMEIEVLGGGGPDMSSMKIEDDDDDEDFSTIVDYESQMNKSSYKHQKLTSIEQREKDEMDFPDEVDTPIDIPARERFVNYRSIKNIKTCDWDPFESLPPEYAKIWRFEDFNQMNKATVQQVENEGLPINGTYIRLVLEPCDDKSKNGIAYLSSSEHKPIIVSTLLPHETKVSVTHFKIKRFDEDKTIIPSKSVLEFHVGFRRYLTRPIFSDEYYGTNKAKYYRFLQHDTETLVSAYTPI